MAGLKPGIVNALAGRHGAAASCISSQALFLLRQLPFHLFHFLLLLPLALVIQDPIAVSVASTNLIVDSLWSMSRCVRANTATA